MDEVGLHDGFAIQVASAVTQSVLVNGYPTSAGTPEAIAKAVYDVADALVKESEHRRHLRSMKHLTESQQDRIERARKRAAKDTQ